MRDVSSLSELSNEEIITAFVSVLKCSKDNARVFLESSLWNIEKAVNFWSESDNSSLEKSKRSPNELLDGKPKYQHIQLAITDLPQNWSAWVHNHKGSVYFLNGSNGVVQHNVPSGFADIVATTTSTATTATSSNMNTLDLRPLTNDESESGYSTPDIALQRSHRS